MTEGLLRQHVERGWSELAAEKVTSERGQRVNPLSVSTRNGPLATSLDHQGHRHLLVPVNSKQRLRSGLDGPVLTLRSRVLSDEDTYQAYADLACLKSEYDDLFSLFCVDVLEAVEQLPENPLKALYRVVDRWKGLFRSPGPLLGPEQIAGLFGEVSVLERLLAEDRSAHRLWSGPHGEPHDFVGGDRAIEVKSSTAEEGRRPRIHGLQQLQAPTGGELQLVWLRLRRVPVGGTGLVELVDRILDRCDDENAVLTLLGAVGYHTVDAERYRSVRFEIEEERWYRVDDSFPKLTAQLLTDAHVPLHAIDVEYTIDLTGESPVPMTEEDVAEGVQRLLLEPHE